MELLEEDSRLAAPGLSVAVAAPTTPQMAKPRGEGLPHYPAVVVTATMASLEEQGW